MLTFSRALTPEGVRSRNNYQCMSRTVPGPPPLLHSEPEIPPLSASERSGMAPVVQRTTLADVVYTIYDVCERRSNLSRPLVALSSEPHLELAREREVFSVRQYAYAHKI